ncbi:hypothetical protein CAPTEDRAFT_194429 [Capitella teleta]|uniref:F5/8 type C domain-containing protein n=1 Tax=Capitella teleta TaxID=283909 RepID=R7U411_CAPTE|nr:hypothetical protein CAPTEDRAFT_194429 [Capitella teleta]|eukprot:ELU00856.1 hypothetical protein CAPTEDRAFT_194429 [Capitella teleta]
MAKCTMSASNLGFYLTEDVILRSFLLYSSDEKRVLSDNESHSTKIKRRITRKEFAVMTKVLLLFLCSMRGLIGVNTFCQCIGYEPLIINASDSQLSVSSVYDSRFEPLSSKWTELGWAPNQRVGSWIEVDLLENKLIGGIVTWGRGSNDTVPQWVKSFNVKYRVDGSNDWNNYTDTGGSLLVSIVARYIRLYPLSWNNGPTMRWEVLGCAQYAQSHVNRYLHQEAETCAITSENCMLATNNRILLNYKGLITQSNTTNLVLNGKSLSCNNKSMTIGIETGMIGCAVEYNMCEMNDANGDGKCHVLCELKVWQVGQPFNLLLLITGDSDMELCAVEIDLRPWKPGRSVIGDWESFLQKIAINDYFRYVR